MEIFSELNKSLKQLKNALKEAGANRQPKDLDHEPGKAGRELSSESGKVRGITGQPSAPPGHVQPQTDESALTPHKGYSKLTARVKTKNRRRIKGNIRFLPAKTCTRTDPA